MKRPVPGRARRVREAAPGKRTGGQHQNRAPRLIGELLGVSDMTIGLIIAETRQLLNENGTARQPCGFAPRRHCVNS